MGRTSAADILRKKPRRKKTPDEFTPNKMPRLTKEEEAYNKWYWKNHNPTTTVDVYQDGELITTLKLTKTQKWDYVRQMVLDSGKEILNYNPVPLWSMTVLNDGDEQIWVYHHKESWEERCCYGKCFSL